MVEGELVPRQLMKTDFSMRPVICDLLCGDYTGNWPRPSLRDTSGLWTQTRNVCLSHLLQLLQGGNL